MLGRSLGDLTILEIRWLQVQSAISRGWRYCFRCDTANAPVRHSRSGREGAAVHCRNCGAALREGEGRGDDFARTLPYCPECEHECEAGTGHCPICGVDLVNDEHVALLNYAMSEDVDYGELVDMFRRVVKPETLPPDAMARFLEFGAAVDRGDVLAAKSEDIRATMAGSKPMSDLTKAGDSELRALGYDPGALDDDEDEGRDGGDDEDGDDDGAVVDRDRLVREAAARWFAVENDDGDDGTEAIDG